MKCTTCGDNLTADEIYLHENNWDHWYAGKGWWVRADTVSDPTRQDYTNYLYPTADALEFTKHPKPVPYYGDIGAALAIGVETDRKATAKTRDR